MEDNFNDFITVSKKLLSEINISEYQIIIGISGFGNVGFFAMNHMVETLNLRSFAYWGDSSWFYKGNLESIITIYLHEESKSILVVPRYPFHVTSVPQRFWDALSRDLIVWGAKRYIVIGGLRESTRSPESTDWVAFVPTPKWTELYGETRTFEDKLIMIGALSSILTYATAGSIPAIGILVYCNREEDPESAVVALQAIKAICKINIPSINNLHFFNYSFIPRFPPRASDFIVHDDEEDDEDEDDLPGFDPNDLV